MAVHGILISILQMFKFLSILLLQSPFFAFIEYNRQNYCLHNSDRVSINSSQHLNDFSNAFTATLPNANMTTGCFTVDMYSSCWHVVQLSAKKKILMCEVLSLSPLMRWWATRPSLSQQKTRPAWNWLSPLLILILLLLSLLQLLTVIWLTSKINGWQNLKRFHPFWGCI